MSIIALHKNKKNLSFFLLLLIISWCFAWGTIGGPDYDSYVFHYYNISLSNVESDIGYDIFVHIFSNILHVSFNLFRAVYYLIGYTLIGKSIWDYSEEPNKILLVYFLVLMPVDVVQIRNFLASAILLYSFRYTFSKEVIKNIVFIIICSLFHKTFIIYLFIPFIVFINKETVIKNFWFYLFLVTIISVLLHLNKSFLINLLFEIASIFIKTGKILYFTTKTRYGYWLYWLNQLYLLFVMYQLRPVFTVMEKRKVPAQYIMALSLNFVLSFSFPLFMFNNTYLRFFRNLFVINYIYIDYGISRTQRYRLYNQLMLFLYLLLSWVVFSAAFTCVPPLFLDSIFF